MERYFTFFLTRAASQMRQRPCLHSLGCRVKFQQLCHALLMLQGSNVVMKLLNTELHQDKMYSSFRWSGPLTVYFRKLNCIFPFGVMLGNFSFFPVFSSSEARGSSASSLLLVRLSMDSGLDQLNHFLKIFSKVIPKKVSLVLLTKLWEPIFSQLFHGIIINEKEHVTITNE